MDLTRTNGWLEKFYQRYVHEADLPILTDTFDKGFIRRKNYVVEESLGACGRMTSIVPWLAFPNSPISRLMHAPLDARFVEPHYSRRSERRTMAVDDLLGGRQDDYHCLSTQKLIPR